MAMTGDFSGLDKLAEALAQLTQVPSQASVEVAQELTKELQREFKQGTDPYGRAWKPLKPSTLKRGRKPPPLTDSGRMRDGTFAQPMRGAGVQIVVGAPYGVFHQVGTRTMASRPILPGRGMPKAWSNIVKAAVSKAIMRRLGK